MAVKNCEERVAVADVSLVYDSILHILSPTLDMMSSTLHFGRAKRKALPASLGDVLLLVRLR